MTASTEFHDDHRTVPQNGHGVSDTASRGERDTNAPEQSLTYTPYARSEVRKSRFAGLIHKLYRILNCRRRLTPAELLINLACRLEGGAMRSGTARELMAQYHGTSIGAYSYGDCFSPKVMPKGVTIGRYVSIAKGVRMFTQNHPLTRLSTHPFFYELAPGNPASTTLEPGYLTIGHDVWIGCNAIITPGCHRIGNGAVIGAGAVVTKDVPDFAIVAGNPAKRIRDRFPAAVIERLNAEQWWLKSFEEIQALKTEFESA